MTRLQAQLSHRQQVATTAYRRPTYATSGFDLSDTSSQSDCTRPPEVGLEEINAIERLYGAGRKPTTVALSFRRKSDNSLPIRRHQPRLPKVQPTPSRLDAHGMRNSETTVIPQIDKIDKSSQFKHGLGYIGAVDHHSTVNATSEVTFRGGAKHAGVSSTKNTNNLASLDCSPDVGVESAGSRCMQCQLNETVATGTDTTGRHMTGCLLNGNHGNTTNGGLRRSKSFSNNEAKWNVISPKTVQSNFTVSTTQECTGAHQQLSAADGLLSRAPAENVRLQPPLGSESTCVANPSTSHAVDEEPHPMLPIPRLNSLFNTHTDIAKFRQLLRESTDEAVTEARVNYCDTATTTRVEAWLKGVRSARESVGGLCRQTVDDSLESERKMVVGKEKLARVDSGDNSDD